MRVWRTIPRFVDVLKSNTAVIPAEA